MCLPVAKPGWCQNSLLPKEGGKLPSMCVHGMGVGGFSFGNFLSEFKHEVAWLQVLHKILEMEQAHIKYGCWNLKGPPIAS